MLRTVEHDAGDVVLNVDQDLFQSGRRHGYILGAPRAEPLT
jgi:hypothetical protein